MIGNPRARNLAFVTFMIFGWVASADDGSPFNPSDLRVTNHCAAKGLAGSALKALASNWFYLPMNNNFEAGIAAEATSEGLDKWSALSLSDIHGTPLWSYTGNDCNGAAAALAKIASALSAGKWVNIRFNGSNYPPQIEVIEPPADATQISAQRKQRFDNSLSFSCKKDPSRVAEEKIIPSQQGPSLALEPIVCTDELNGVIQTKVACASTVASRSVTSCYNQRVTAPPGLSAADAQGLESPATREQ